MRAFVSRRLVTVLLVLGAVVLSIPAVTLASGGGSAGDQQYTDPFAGTSTPTGGTHTATLTQTATPPSTATTAPPTSPATAATTPTSDPSSTPTATTATGQLPYTGYDGWLAGGLGFAMVSAGLVLRRRIHRT